MGKLSVEVQERAGRTHVVLGGEADVYTAPRLKEVLVDLVPVPTLVVDLSAVEYLDSTGLGVLIGCHSRRRDNGHGRLILLVNNPRIMRIFTLTGLVKIFGVVESEDAITPELADWPKSDPPAKVFPETRVNQQRRAGRKGGETTAQRHGPQYFEELGRKGAKKMKEYMARGRAAEAAEKERIADS